MAKWRIIFSLAAIFVLLQPVASLSANAAPRACRQVIENSKAPRFFDSDLPSIKPEQFLPADFLAKLREEQGVVHARITRLTENALQFEIFSTQASHRPFVEFEMRRDPELPWRVQIDELRLENPFEDGSKGRLRQSQERKGLPFKAARHLRDGLFALLRREGFRGLRTSGANNFTVLMFYRHLGMVPETDVAAKAIALLESYFKFASQEFPNDERPKSFNDFGKLLGHWSAEREVPYAIEAGWSYYRKYGELWTGFELLKLNDDTIAGFRYTQQNPNGSVSKTIYFVDSSKRELPILQWRDLAHAGQLALRLDLTKTSAE